MKHNATRFCRLLGGFGLAVLSCFVTGHARAEEPLPAYQLLNKIPLHGETAWDYLTLDSGAHRLYVTRTTHVMVIDTEKNTIVGDIPDTPGVHGVAIAPKLGRGYTSNGRENTVTIFDLKSLKELQRVAVGQSPNAILFDAFTNQVFTYNGGSKDITALDAMSGQVLGTIPVGGKPEASVTDDKGTLFVNIEDTNEILAIDAKNFKVKNRWPIAPVDGPAGLAYDKTHRRLFAVGSNAKMAVVDAQTGKLLGAPAIGKGADTVLFDAALGLAISANGLDGTMTLVRTDGKKPFNTAATISTQFGARTMALDTKTHRLYLVTGAYKQTAPGEILHLRSPIELNSAVLLIYSVPE